MKTLLIGINSKYIHSNLAIRLLKANTTYDVDIIEFTIKDSIENIISYIIDNKYEFIGFSSYIWNIEIIKAIIKDLKEKNPKILILLGGPEVSFNASFYINEYNVDFVIRNEGEKAFHLLLEALSNNTSFSNIPNLSYINNDNRLEEIDNLTKLNSPYKIANDNENRIAYIETSRGCPFKCSYCMASLEKDVRFFDIEEVKKNLLYLISAKTKTFKFLDRTFNTNKKHAYDIFDFIIKNHLPGNSFQFEITGDILPTEIIDYLNTHAPKNLFRFEIGIQSTNPLTNKLVNRIQNQEKLFSNIRRIQEANVIDLHLDLIAGLPKEDLKSFEKTFNDVLSLYPKELQLGFLKLLRGTALYNEKDKYGYIFNETSPYEIISNDSLSITDIKTIKTVEQVLEKYYNSGFMRETILYLLKEETSAFAFFKEFGEYYEQRFSWLNYNLADLFERLYNYLKDKIFSEIEYVLYLMKKDYLSYNNVKPKIWWERNQNKNSILRMLKEKNLLTEDLDLLYRYSLVEVYLSKYLVVIYKDNTKKIYELELI